MLRGLIPVTLLSMISLMKARDVYGVILRAFALYLLLWGTWNVLAGVKYLPTSLAAVLARKSSEQGSFGYFFYGVPAVLAGWLMLRFAEECVDYTYRRPKLPPPLPPTQPPAPK